MLLFSIVLLPFYSNELCCFGNVSLFPFFFFFFFISSSRLFSSGVAAANHLLPSDLCPLRPLLYYRIRPPYFLIIVRFFSPSNLFPTLKNVCTLAAILDGQLNLQYSKNLTGFCFIIHFIFLRLLYNVAQLESEICRQFSSPSAYKSISYTQRSIPSVALAHVAFASLSG